MLNHFDDQIKLRTVTHPIVNGFSTDAVNEALVWAEKKSVGSTEFYKAAQIGVKTDVIFAINICDYNNQTEVDYNGEIYAVIRSYQLPKFPDHIELTCQKKV